MQCLIETCTSEGHARQLCHTHYEFHRRRGFSDLGPTFGIRARDHFEPVPIHAPPTELAWMAGFFDGEGSISISKRGGRYHERGTYTLRVHVVNTVEETVVRFVRMFGGTHQHHISVTGKRVYTWSVISWRGVQVIRALRPYLCAKAPQADLAEEFMTISWPYNVHLPADLLEKRADCYERMGGLNRSPQFRKRNGIQAMGGG